ncbi:hypothetical protein SERLA73DRAFT_77914 [Serpula lacrymans var. lacrymans S7.3]|uniref:TLC domain-containing protein n=2 Tax=Serpula lacrymans var. lacrymans TaxID=341189 RepID=F8QBF5_SERL3|nr:hypothetical protein SERLA73DRAFT_77914 [Serpula lacrymans var. lacrymans S7.3]
MELPTFVLAIASLHSRFRSDILFAGCFLFTRIIFHIALCISYFVPANREVITNGSFMPSILLTLIFPLHAFWFYGCLKGFVKRATVKHVPRVVRSQITSDANTPGTASVSPHPSRLWVLPRRRGVLRHALRNLRWEHFELRRAAGRLNEARRRIHATLPATERVYAFVGLQRRNYAGKALMEVQREGW